MYEFGWVGMCEMRKKMYFMSYYVHYEHKVGACVLTHLKKRRVKYTRMCGWWNAKCCYFCWFLCLVCLKRRRKGQRETEETWIWLLDREKCTYFYSFLHRKLNIKCHFPFLEVSLKKVQSIQNNNTKLFL